MTRPQTRFKGSHVVVFGGGSGIGLATATAAKAEGAEITIVGRDQSRLDVASLRLGGVRTAIADLSSRKSIEKAFGGMDRIHHLVITAGGLHAGKLSDTDPDALLKELGEHLAGSVYSIKAAIARMPPSGSIVLMGGQFSDRPTGSGTSTMAMACRGIEALARSVALEFKPIRVNVVAPGFVETPLYDALGSEGRAVLLKQAADTLPVGRIGQPEEIADAILFLLGNRYMNCEVLHIDGGGRFA